MTTKPIFGDLDAKARLAAEAISQRGDEIKIRAAMAAIRLNPKDCGTSCGHCGKLPWEHGDGDWACSPVTLWRGNLRHLGQKWLSIAMRRVLAEGK
jgi:hypothetical protein